MIPPIQHLAAIDLQVANAALVAWGHRMGPCQRPIADIWAHGLFVHGVLSAVTVTSTLVRQHTVGGLDRRQALELARLCSSASALTRVMLRLWRELVHPAYGRPWAISYQDEALHTGNTYRLDGWVRLGRSRSGTDARSGRKGRNKTVWGWHADAAQRQLRMADRMAA